MIRKVVSWIMIVAFLNSYGGVQAALGAAKKDKKVSSKKEANSVLAEYASERIQWKVLFSPGGKSVDISKEMDLDVKGDDVQIILSVVNIEDPEGTLGELRVEAETPSGKTVGKKRAADVRTRGQTWSMAATAELGLKPPPSNETFDKVDAALSVGTRGDEGTDISKIASEEEMDKAYKDYKQKLKKSKDVGFVAEDETGEQGLEALSVINPSDKGKWKMKVNGKTKEAFIAAAIVMPTELTEADGAELQAAYEEIHAAFDGAFPENQEWNPCNSCCRCKGAIYALGIYSLWKAALNVKNAKTLAQALEIIGKFLSLRLKIAAFVTALFTISPLCLISNCAAFVCSIPGWCGQPCGQLIDFRKLFD